MVHEDDRAHRAEDHAVGADEAEELRGKVRESARDRGDDARDDHAGGLGSVREQALESEAGAVDGRVRGGPSGDDHADDASSPGASKGPFMVDVSGEAPWKDLRAGA